jgi:hypothetical protein
MSEYKMGFAIMPNRIAYIAITYIGLYVLDPGIGNLSQAGTFSCCSRYPFVIPFNNKTRYDLNLLAHLHDHHYIVWLNLLGGGGDYANLTFEIRKNNGTLAYTRIHRPVFLIGNWGYYDYVGPAVKIPIVDSQSPGGLRGETLYRQLTGWQFADARI